MTNDLRKVSVAILAGGLGTRLKLPRQQKVVANVGNQPFLKYILDQLNKPGFKNIVICIGYLGDQVKKVFGNNYKSLTLTYAREHSPLGTAGAIRFALPNLVSEDILIINGDSFIDANLKEFFKFHVGKKANGTIILTEVSDTSRYGRVELDENDQIIGFKEKEANRGGGMINAGIYLFKRSLLLKIPEKRYVSFEKDIFQTWIGKGLFGFNVKARFIDIGTPASFIKAEEFFSKNI